MSSATLVSHSMIHRSKTFTIYHTTIQSVVCISAFCGLNIPLIICKTTMIASHGRNLLVCALDFSRPYPIASETEILVSLLVAKRIIPTINAAIEPKLKIPNNRFAKLLMAKNSCRFSVV